MNIVFDADLSRLVEHRPSVLYWVLQPGATIGGIGIGIGIDLGLVLVLVLVLVRMVRPWNQWLVVWADDIGQPHPKVDEAFTIEVVHNFVGDDTVPVTIRSISLWGHNTMRATRYREGRVFCLGDPTHRHPPPAIRQRCYVGWRSLGPVDDPPARCGTPCAPSSPSPDLGSTRGQVARRRAA